MMEDQAKVPVKRSFEIIAVCVVIAVVWGLTLLPTVFYYLPQNTVEESNRTNNVSTSMTPCSAETYLGSTCRDELLSYQGCIVQSDGNENVNIPSGRNQEQTEDHVKQLLLWLQFFDTSPECLQTAKPFLCLYMFGLCSSSGILLPSARECRRVGNDVCAMEWQRAVPLLGNQLPQCESLPDTSLDHNNCFGSALGSGLPPVAESGQKNNNTNLTIACSVDFYLDSDVCQPQCGQWKAHSHSIVIITEVMLGVTTAVGTIASILFLVISCVRYKQLFKFPSVFIVYQTIPLLVLGIFLLIGYMDRDGLFCSSPNTLKSLENPSIFCTITGIVFVYVLMQLALWWLLHIIVIFFGVVFTLQAKTIQAAGRCRHVHASMVIIGLVVPCAPVVISLVRSGYASLSPSILCSPKDGAAAFYSLVLPISAFLATGISLLVLMFVTIAKVTGFRKKTKVVEIKVLIILGYFIIFGVSALTTFGVTLRNGQNFRKELVTYFLCESTGISGDKVCSRMGIEQFSTPIPIALTLLLFGLYPVVNLVYAVQIQELKQKFKSMTSNLSQCVKLKRFQLPKTQTTATTGTDAV